MRKSKRLLFWGELPPSVYHGISMSNERVLQSLSREFETVKVCDNSSFGGIAFSLYSFFISIAKILFKSVIRVHVFYVNSPTSFMGLLKVLLATFVVRAFSPGVCVIAHLHRGDFSSFIRKKTNKRLFLMFSKNIDLLIALSDSSAEELKNSGLIGSAKVTVLHNTVSVLSKESVIKQKNKSVLCHDRYFYCLSNYLPTKRIDTLVVIANEVKEGLFVFNGFTPDAEYMKRLEHMDINSVCRFEGVIDGIDKEERLFAARALVLPSLNEGMPLVILESLAQGTPVICFDIGYIRDYLGPDYPGLVKELSDSAMRAKIEWLSNLSNTAYLELRARSLTIFWECFAPVKLDKEVLHTFNGVIR